MNALSLGYTEVQTATPGTNELPIKSANLFGRQPEANTQILISARYLVPPAL